MDEKITDENTSQKVNMKTAGSSTTTLNEFQMKNFSNCREYEKMINTGKLRIYSSFPSVYHLLNSGEWMEIHEQWMEIYEQKKNVKNKVKFKQTCREVRVLHAVHFQRICFAIKAERMIPPFSQLLENDQETEKTINMKKFCIFLSFSTVYLSDHGFRQTLQVRTLGCA